MRVIGIAGVRGSGKDTTFNILKSIYPNIKKVSLAGRLKRACTKALGLSTSQLNDPAIKDKFLDMPIYLTKSNIQEILECFGKSCTNSADYDTYIRPHVGIVLESPRRVMQYVGTEILRALGEAIHVKTLCGEISIQEGVYFITDVRFLNEYQYLKDTFKDSFESWYIQNNKAECVVDPHPSEKGVRLIRANSIQIYNNGTLKDLEKLVTEVYNG